MCIINSIFVQFLMQSTTPRTTLKSEVYELLKLWDRKRAQLLRAHKKAAQQIAESIEKKVQDSKDFINSLQTMLEERVNQLRAYCANSVVDSSLIFDKNRHQAYNSHYELLREMFTIEADNAKKSSQKLAQLTEILQQLKGVMQNGQTASSSSENKNDESSLVIAKGSIKYLIDCQLPEIVEQVIEQSDKVSKIKNESQNSDLYFAIQDFVRMCQKQTNKHREIGRELLSFVSTSMKRQITVQNKIRSCLKKWSQIDGPIDPIFIEQLEKKEPNFFVKDFYDIQQMTNVGFQQQNIQDFLINFKSDQFNQHERLKLCDVDGFYNSKIETRILVTIDGFVHLIRANAYRPDFSLRLNPELSIKKTKECSVSFVQYKKKYYFKKEKQYQFMLEFNTEDDLHYFKTIVQKISECKIE